MQKINFGDFVVLVHYISSEFNIDLLYKAEKLSVRLRHRIISVVSAWIDLELGLCIAEAFEKCIDVFPSI